VIREAARSERNVERDRLTTGSLSHGANLRDRPLAGKGNGSPLNAGWRWPGAGPSGKARSGTFSYTRSASCSSSRATAGTMRSAGALNCAPPSSRSGWSSYPGPDPRPSPCSTHRRVRPSRASPIATSMRRHPRPTSPLSSPHASRPPHSSLITQHPWRSWRPFDSAQGKPWRFSCPLALSVFSVAQSRIQGNAVA